MRCPRCKNDKPETDFHKNASRPSGRSGRCKQCRSEVQKILSPVQLIAKRKRALEWVRRNPGYMKTAHKKYHLRKKYGLSVLEFEALSLQQNHRCAICKQTKKLCVDHDHNTGKVRGLLCRGCNTGLGGFLDSQASLVEAIKYLIPETKGFSDVHWLQIEAPV